MRKLLYCYIAKLLKNNITIRELVSRKLEISERKRAITIKQFNSGFSLIELMVVLTLFGVATTLVTASYLRFERAQRLKNAALTLVSDLRYVQSKATAQDKGPGGTSCVGVPTCCPTATKVNLGGWYLIASSNSGSNSSYNFGGDCLDASGGTVVDTRFSVKAVNLPRNIVISSIAYDGFANPGSLGFLFRPQKIGMTVHNNIAFISTLDFFDDASQPKNCFSSCTTTDSVVLTLSDASGDNYYVKMQANGEIEESKTP